MDATQSEPLGAPSQSLITVVHVVYALHAVGLGIGAFTASSLVGAFLFGWPSIVGVIINYVMRSDANDTWLASHFRWQIRTFWLAGGASLLIALISAPLVLALGLGLLTWFVGIFAVGVWAIYRIARGWLRLRDQQPMPF